jgi:selenocysteine lyase/cysteine desulfurase
VNVNVDQVRQQIPALEQSVYLNTGGTGPSPVSVTDVVVSTHRRIVEGGPDSRPVRAFVAEQIEQARNSVSRFVGADPGEIAFIRSISEGVSAVAWGLDWKPGDEVIITDQEHPTGLMPWHVLQERAGINLRRVPARVGSTAFLEELSNTINDRTRLVAMSHVTCETGTRLPAAEISKLCHDRGVLVLFDGAQSVGQFPVDLHEIDADFYSFSGHKWLLAGLGTAALYVRQSSLDVLKMSWTGSGATETLDRHSGEFTWREDASRFEFGNRNWALVAGLGAAVEYVDQLGMPAIEGRVQELAGWFADQLAEIPGVVVHSPEDPSERTGIVTFEIQGVSGTDVFDLLWDRGKIVCRAALDKEAARISVALFTTQAELQAALDVVDGIARGANS